MPGPFQAFLLAQTLQHGWKRTLPATLAPLFSDGPIIALVLFILTQTPEWLLRSIRIAGGIFILYLAFGAYQTARQPCIGEHSQSPRPRSLTKAAVMNLLNPNPYLFWGAVAGPILLEGWRRSAGLGISFITSFYGAMVGGSAALVILFATASQIGSQTRRLLIWASALALLVFGLYQLWTGITPGH